MTLSEALERLPQREVDLLRLHYWEGRSQAFIAQVFGITQAAVSYRLDRGLSRLFVLLREPL